MPPLDILFSSNNNIHKSSYGLCFWVPDPLIGPGANEQSPNELLWTLSFDETVQYLRVAWICKFIVLISLLFPAEQQQKQTEIAIFSQNCVQILEFAIDFWCLQLTFDIFNWVYSKHMIHYNKVNWKNFAKNFLKIFPIDFQSPIDFSQLHMIRP